MVISDGADERDAMISRLACLPRKQHAAGTRRGHRRRGVVPGVPPLTLDQLKAIVTSDKW